MTPLRRGLAAATLAAIVTALSAGPAAADHVRVVGAVTVSHLPKAAQGYSLEVRMRTSDGRPLNDAVVRFYEIVELFGRREMLIATTRTDGQGVGTAAYLPARPGRHEIVARFPGREHVGPADVRHTFEADVAAPPYRQDPLPLTSFSAAVPYGVGLVVLGVWALIAFALFGTAFGIRRGRRDRQHIA